jgi:hypothetical protein
MLTRVFYPWGSNRGSALIKTDDVLGVTVCNTFFHGIFRVTFLLAARPRELRGPAKSRVKQIYGVSLFSVSLFSILSVTAR